MTWFVVGAGCEDVLIGKPIENTVVVLVDAQYEPVPIGVPGEIVFGSCIARGYLHRDDLTAAKFVPNKLWGPAAPSDGAVAHSSSSDDAAVQSPGPAPTPTPKYLVDMKSDSKVPPSPLVYKTGDLAVRLGSGDLRFMGRVDRQVKVRGFRIELEAVEAGTPHALELYPRRADRPTALPQPNLLCSRVRSQCRARSRRITVLKEYKPPLKQLAVVAVKEQRGNELATRPAVHEVAAPMPEPHCGNITTVSLVMREGQHCLPYAREGNACHQHTVHGAFDAPQVAFIAKAALSEKGAGGLNLLEHCEAKLPKYMVPSKVVALDAFPCLPNGKLNLAALASGSAKGDVVESAAMADAKAGKKTATDSLGMVRELAGGDGEQSSLQLETQVADVLRALFMYGVIVDHWSDCGDTPGVCQRCFGARSLD